MKQYFTESRIAIAISVISLGFTTIISTAQWEEARIANGLNEENVDVVIQPNEDPSNAVGTPRCVAYEVSIPLTWRIQMINHSTQPVTIMSAYFSGYSARGPSLRSDAHEGRDTTGQSFPLTIPPKQVQPMVVTAPVLAPQSYSTWFRASGLCNNNTLDINKLTARAGFTSTGGSGGHPSNVGISLVLTTADGKVIQRQANWVAVLNVKAPDIKMP